MNTKMATETTPLRGGPCQPPRYLPVLAFVQKHYVSVLAFIFCFSLAAAQLSFQIVLLPSLLEGIPHNAGLLISTFSSEIVEDMIEWAWVLITDDVDRYFHDGLIGARLSPKQRDALRKVDCLAAALQIGTTKVPGPLVSLIQAFCQVAGVFTAITICVGLIGLNFGSRVLGGQHKAVEKNWDRTVARNKSLLVDCFWSYGHC